MGGFPTLDGDDWGVSGGDRMPTERERRTARAARRSWCPETCTPAPVERVAGANYGDGGASRKQSVGVLPQVRLITAVFTHMTIVLA